MDNTTRRELKEKIENPDIAEAFEGVFADHVIDHPLLQNASVYPHLHANTTDWEQTSTQDAQPYLPIQQQDPINVTLGIKQLSTISLPVLGSTSIDKYFQYKRGYLINTGGNIFGLDFAPKTSSIDTQPMIQYLAIGGYKEANVLHSFETPRRGHQNCIQLWKCDLSTKTEAKSPVLDLVLLHDYGDVRELKWCPYGAYEETMPTGITDDSTVLPKLGILAGCFGDGTVRCLVVPHPDTLRTRLGLDAGNQDPVYLKIKQCRCVFALPNTSFSTLSWGGHKKLAIGSSSGHISLWNMISALNEDQEKNAKDQQQSVRFMIWNAPVHEAGIQSIVWHGMEDPVNFISCGNDGKLNALDIRDPFILINFSRLRAIQYDAVWAGYRNKIMYVDGESILKEFSPLDIKNFKAGNVNAMCSGAFTSMASSEQHSFVSLASSEGFLKLINAYIKRVKGRTKLQKIVYKLMYNEKENVYRYVDGLKSQNVDETKALSLANIAVDPKVSISKVCWSPNSKTSAWGASGGSNGVCRLDFMGVGDKWNELDDS